MIYRSFKGNHMNEDDSPSQTTKTFDDLSFMDLVSEEKVKRISCECLM